MPLGVGEDADDNAKGEESGGQAHEGAKNKAASHEENGEGENGLAGPATGGDGPVGAGFGIEVEIVPVVKKTATEVEE